MLTEIKRALRKNGIVRIVVPDLENICIEYLKKLNEVVSDKSKDEQYKWITIELLDQLTRVNSGGYMLEVFNEVKNRLLYMYLKFIRLLIPTNLRDLIFNSTGIGEKHQWMYDRYSLNKLLEQNGFKDIKILNFNESNINNFNSYMLDINEDGTPYKGISSLYIEAKV